MKTKEELHLVMTAPPPPPPPVYEPVSYHVQESPQEEGAEPMGYSAELCSEGILDDRNEEKRITEAEKNERVQRQLLVSRGGAGPALLSPGPVPFKPGHHRGPLHPATSPFPRGGVCMPSHSVVSQGGQVLSAAASRCRL